MSITSKVLHEFFAELGRLLSLAPLASTSEACSSTTSANESEITNKIIQHILALWHQAQLSMIDYARSMNLESLSETENSEELIKDIFNGARRRAGDVGIEIAKNIDKIPDKNLTTEQKDHLKSLVIEMNKFVFLFLSELFLRDVNYVNEYKSILEKHDPSVYLASFFEELDKIIAVEKAEIIKKRIMTEIQGLQKNLILKLEQEEDSPDGDEKLLLEVKNILSAHLSGHLSEASINKLQESATRHVTLYLSVLCEQLLPVCKKYMTERKDYLFTSEHMNSTFVLKVEEIKIDMNNQHCLLCYGENASLGELLLARIGKISAYFNRMNDLEGLISVIKNFIPVIRNDQDLQSIQNEIKTQLKNCYQIIIPCHNKDACNYEINTRGVYGSLLVKIYNFLEKLNLSDDDLKLSKMVLLDLCNVRYVSVFETELNPQQASDDLMSHSTVSSEYLVSDDQLSRNLATPVLQKSKRIFSQLNIEQDKPTPNLHMECEGYIKILCQLSGKDKSDLKTFTEKLHNVYQEWIKLLKSSRSDQKTLTDARDSLFELISKINDNINKKKYMFKDLLRYIFVARNGNKATNIPQTGEHLTKLTEKITSINNLAPHLIKLDIWLSRKQEDANVLKLFFSHDTKNFYGRLEQIKKLIKQEFRSEDEFLSSSSSSSSTENNFCPEDCIRQICAILQFNSDAKTPARFSGSLFPDESVAIFSEHSTSTSTQTDSEYKDDLAVNLVDNVESPKNGESFSPRVTPKPSLYGWFVPVALGVGLPVGTIIAILFGLPLLIAAGATTITVGGGLTIGIAGAEIASAVSDFFTNCAARRLEDYKTAKEPFRLVESDDESQAITDNRSEDTNSPDEPTRSTATNTDSKPRCTPSNFFNSTFKLVAAVGVGTAAVAGLVIFAKIAIPLAVAIGVVTGIGLLLGATIDIAKGEREKKPGFLSAMLCPGCFFSEKAHRDNFTPEDKSTVTATYF